MKPIDPKIKTLLIIFLSALIPLFSSGQSDRLYYGVEIDGVLCGYSTSDESKAEYLGKPVLDVKDSVHLMLKVLGQDLNADIISHYYIDPSDGNVLFNKVHYNTTDAGRVITTQTTIFPEAGYAIHMQEESGITDTISLSDGVIFDNPQSTPYLINDFVHEGAEKKTYHIFDYVKGIVAEQEFTLEGEEVINLAGNDYTALIFNVYNSEIGTNTRTWVNKEDATTLQFEILNRRIFLAESAVIKKINTVDMDNNLFARVEESIANFMDMTYLKVKADIKSAGEEITAEGLNFPGQTFTGSVNENHIVGVFELEPPRYDGSNAPPFPADFSGDDDLKKYLEPEIFIESDHPDIIAKAEEITDGAEHSWEAAVRLSEWVGKEIAGAVPGGTSAINTLRIREGECGSHSRLLAAFCRAVGIPSRLAIGCLYSPWYGGSFGQHAWTEVYMGDEVGWVAVDATILEFDYIDAGHIKLGEQSSFQPHSMEILEYRIGDEEAVSDVPEAYRDYLGPYINPDNRNVLEVIYADGSLTLDILGRMKLALHEPDEEGRMYAKLTDKVYLRFAENSMTITENAYAMKKQDAEIDIDEATPEEMKPVIGPYVIFQIQAEFTVAWDDGMKMYVPDVEAARSLIKTEYDSWKDTVDGKEYSFAFNDDGSVSGMNILVSTELKKGFTASYIVDKTIKEDGMEAAKNKFRELWDNRALDLEYTEGDMNDLGYKYLGEDKLEEALMVFKLNVEAFPQSYNVYDSYGEALMKSGEKEEAIENYKRSIELNPDNENGKRMLEKLTLKEGE